MKEVTAEQIKDLRERTGVGVAKCKEALAATHGNIEEAINYLRKSGAASAVKKQARETNEGLIAVVEHGEYIVALKVDCETDFVSQNEKFREFVHNLATEIALDAPASLNEFYQQTYSKDKRLKIEDLRVSLVQSMGENIQISKFEIFSKRSDLSIGFYVHAGGKMASVVELQEAKGFELVAKEIAMHAVAASPTYLNPTEISAEVLHREKEIIREQIKNKPKDMQDKIIEGKLKAFYESVCLIHQKYIKDPAITVEQFLLSKNKNLKIRRFIRWQVGN